MRTIRPLLLVATISASFFPVLMSCRNHEARLIAERKVIRVPGRQDTIFFERSRYWDDRIKYARVERNRQKLRFAPGKDPFLISIRNMGGVPLKQDRIPLQTTVDAEDFLRLATRDTNLRMTIEFKDYRKAKTDILLFIRNRDSVFEEISIEG